MGTSERGGSVSEGKKKKKKKDEQVDCSVTRPLQKGAAHVDSRKGRTPQQCEGVPVQL
jgi:hypothetical protein